jgi:8-oxo-dGTP pyrophosphatase MutT (NUDIX family)
MTRRRRAGHNRALAIPLNSDIVLTPPVDAATVMVVRDGSAGLEVLLVRRHGNAGVLGGVHVFPGGKLDATDCDRRSAWHGMAPEACVRALAEPDLDPCVAVGLHRAAMRETHEECGLRLAPTDLVPWSRWITPRQPSVTHKRFDTRFFVAPVPDHQAAVPDGHEATEVVWLTARCGLQRYWSGEIDLAPPQIMSLVQLLPLPDVKGVMSLARARAPALIEPQPFDRNGVRVICYPGDPAHPVREAAWHGPTSLCYRNRRFEAEGGLEALLG